MSEVPDSVYQILNEAVHGDINNYTINEHDKNKKGEGFTGEMCFVSLKNKHGDEDLHYVVKQRLPIESPRVNLPISAYFLNEISFYTAVWPHFQKFQKDKLNGEALDIIPKCFATSSKDRNENLVLENLKFQDFQMHNKTNPLSNEQIELIFKQYGRFHAISFAYKFINPREYSEISSKLQNLWPSTVRMFKEFMGKINDICLEFLDPDEESKVIEKFRSYAESSVEVFTERSRYKGCYSAVLHGDCWSNNMMFKYNEDNKLTDMRLLDFQFANVGTPVSDLSYFLYSGAGKEVLDELDRYLRLYHTSLTKTLEHFGCDSENIYPFDALKKDWKDYCKTGFSMALLVWRGKFTNPSDVKDLQDILEETDTLSDDKNSKDRYDEQSFKETVKNLILHMYDNDFL
ncbi:hypothetical protein NQ317_017768 [Molorchus minor]|uniref:CHK kinase-like domain-containing protein n=1 Tax=Molorchus minor TaxID=1323400 RepID=A0ABQ9JH44_9CUCU|nr:hypothetical protein NQ317_017768 [Molorchus minor]